jgi:protein TonB
MQIVVSKTGSVETVRVIKGPEGLRNAAVNAVRNWRYSPYVVDGRPMDIATTVYINFH